MITVTRDQIPVEETIISLRSPECGAVISYLGTVRNYLYDRQSKGLSFEVDDAVMREKLQEVEAETLQRFEVSRMAIVHRTGSFDISDTILLVAISAGHRGPAFDACHYAIDRLKELHEEWKREELAG
ncbi:MAG: molybdenum cofactor biosynthesis protein MoaE [Dehalococcoidia bacterium]